MLPKANTPSEPIHETSQNHNLLKSSKHPFFLNAPFLHVVVKTEQPFLNMIYFDRAFLVYVFLLQKSKWEQHSWAYSPSIGNGN